MDARDLAAPQNIHAHKLFAPRRHGSTITRAAILHRILAPDAPRVVLLQGPAGHGKTTTLQQLKSEFEAQDCQTAWLTFDDADNDARRGFLHIHASVLALLKAASGTVAEDGVADEPSHRKRSDWMIGHLMRLGRPVVLFFDEFQTLHEKPLLSFFRGLLERVPDSIRIFIGSRALPDIGLSRLVVNHQALILNADDLRFSPAEMEQFFASSGELALSGAELEAIYARTEGWPAALQLFRLALASPHVRRSLGMLATYRPRELTDYLVENVLNLQPPDVQTFLLRTSLMHKIDGALGDEVTGRADSGEVLSTLERSGLFLRPLDGEPGWFKYHGLFSAFLADHQRALSPATARAVHASAARWHRAHGLLDEAVHHFIACGDFPEAADTMDVWASSLTAGGLLVTVERWYDRLPAAEVCCRPSLMIKMAYALLFLRRRGKMAPLLTRLAEPDALHRGPDAKPVLLLGMAAICADDVAGAHAIIDGVRLQGFEPAGFEAFELGAAANLAAYCQMADGDLEQAHEYLALARCYNDRGDASFSDGYTWGMLGVHRLLLGQLPAALEQFRLGMARQAMHLDGSFASAALVACSIWAHYEANQLDRVEALFAQYHDGIADAVLLDFLAVAYLPMARTHDARGRPEKATEVLDEAEAIGHANGWHRLVRMVQWERSRRWLVAGEPARALALAGRIAPAAAWHAKGWRVFSEEMGGEMLARLRASVHGATPEAATRILAAELGRHRDKVSLRIRLHLLDALLQERKGAHGAAHRSLRRALALAQPGGFIRCFIDEGEGVLQLLRDAYQAILNDKGGDVVPNPDRSFVEQILQAAGTDLTRARVVAAPLLEALTDREMEILAMLASGGSNRDIAERLFVSENTVKFHLKNVYAKLSVANRLQAIIAAQHLGIGATGPGERYLPA